jgi:hypothetical protein
MHVQVKSSMAAVRLALEEAKSVYENNTPAKNEV